MVIPRAVFRLTVAILLTGGFAVGVLAGWSERSGATTEGTAPVSSQFDLSAPAVKLINGVHVTDGDMDYLQTFGFVDGSIYVVTTDHTSDRPATMLVTRLSTAGNVLSHMHLKNFHNHGSEIAFSAKDGTVYLWVIQNCSSCTRKQYLRRVTYQAEGPNTQPTGPGSSGVIDVTPQDADLTTMNLNPTIDKFGTPKLVVGWKTAGEVHHLRAYNLSSASLPVGPAIYTATFADPFKNYAGKQTLHQGVAVYGQYAYFYQGSPFCPGGSNCAGSAAGNTYITPVDLSTGTVGAHTQITIWSDSLTGREPEGISIREGAAGRPEIGFGFADPRYGDHKVYIATKPNSWPTTG